MPRGATNRITLGTFVRTKRGPDGLGMSQEDLATRARVSRSTVHRIEHDYEVRPTAPKLAQIFAVIGAEPHEIEEVLADDSKLLHDVLHWLDRSKQFVGLAQAASSYPALQHVANGPPALIVIKDDKMAEVRGPGVDDVKEVLKDAGWLVMRPD